MKNQNGFTLVEVVIASMLLGMVFLSAFPIVTTGYRMMKQEQEKIEAQIIGNSEFDRIASELQTAKYIFLGTKEELEAIQEDAEEWKYIDHIFSDQAFDMIVDVEILEDHWLYMTVTLSDENKVVYNREEMISLLNYGFYKDASMEGVDSITCSISDRRITSDEAKIWYQSIEE